MPLHATSFRRAGEAGATPSEIVVLDSRERHLRRKLVTLHHGDEVLVDFDRPVKLRDRDCLILDDGRQVEVIAAEEDLIEVRGHNVEHLIRLAWHIGNRHLEAQIEMDRILIRDDRVIAHMLEHQGANVANVRETFEPEHGAYHAHDP